MYYYKTFRELRNAILKSVTSPQCKVYAPTERSSASKWVNYSDWFPQNYFGGETGAISGHAGSFYTLLDVTSFGFRRRSVFSETPTWSQETESHRAARAACTRAATGKYLNMYSVILQYVSCSTQQYTQTRSESRTQPTCTSRTACQ